MNNVFDILAGLIGTVISFFQRKPAPVAPVVPAPTPDNPTPKPDNVATAKQVILSQSMSLGPMPGTGGVIHKLSDADAQTIAELIVSNCAKYPKLSIPLMLAWIRCESDFDPKAVDPNQQNWPKNPSANDKLVNLDLGLAQFSWRTLAAMPDFKGMTSDEIQTQALDAEWSAGAMFAFCDNLRQQAQAAVLADKSLLDGIPSRDVSYLMIEAYNVGFAGAVDMIRTNGLGGNWAYAQSVLGYYEKWASLFV